MFSQTTELYDFIYSEFKDFRAEAGKVARLIRKASPTARTILDVGAGTGRHAQALIEDHGFLVDGIDIESGFLEIARARCPDGEFFLEDMAEFDLGRTFDGVICLFSSIGYVRTTERLRSAARSFFRHVAPGGVAVVEPWFSPEVFVEGALHLNVVDRPDLKITRMNHTEVIDGISRLDFHYLVGDSDGVRHLQETHELGLFSMEEMGGAFEAAGFDSVESDPEGLTGRGMLVCRKAPDG